MLFLIVVFMVLINRLVLIEVAIVTFIDNIGSGLTLQHSLFYIRST